MKFGCGLCSLQIFNAIPLRFSRRLRNSPRPWVKHAQRPTTSDSLEKTHQKAKSSMSLQPHQNFIRHKSFTITVHVLQFTFYGLSHLLFSAFFFVSRFKIHFFSSFFSLIHNPLSLILALLHLWQSRLVNN
jgi:hypothetical protein